MRTPLAILACVLLAALGACGGERSASRAGGEASIAASIPPLAWVAQGLAPQGASVTTLLPPGASEHGYEPPPSRLAAFVRADAVLLVGLGLDLPAQRAIENTRRRDRAVVVFADATDLSGSEDGHDHEDHSDHTHAHPSDPHLWLDPPRMADLVRAAHEALAARALPEELPALAARRDALLREVERVDSACRERLAPYRGGVIVAAHDSVRRFADRYGLRVAGAIHAHEGSEPAPGEIVAAARALRDAPHRAILVEPQSGRALAERLSRETGAPVAEFDSLGRGDWPATMLANLDALERAFAASAPAPSDR